MEKKSSKKSRISSIIGVVIALICVPIFLINVVIIVDSIIHPDEVPGIFGYKPFVVYSGSMKNVMPVGSLCVVKEVDSITLKKGDIISFRIDDTSVVTHRIVNVKTENNKTYYVTRGDQNNTNDKLKVTSSMIEGKYLFNIAYLGYIVMFLKEPLGLVCALLIIIFSFIVYLCLTDKSKE